MTKILAIEDDPSILENILETLQLEDYETLGANNGRLGIELARTHLPDLIICDVMMPELNGYEVLLNLRSEASTSAIPFIFLTGRGSRTDIREGMELGADDYLIKPFLSVELLAAVKSRVERHREITIEYAQKVNEVRGSMLHMLPHEFRTPLTAILGYSDLIMSNASNMDVPYIVELVKRIHQGGTRLYHLVDNFLLYAQLELLQSDSAEIERLRQAIILNPKPLIEQTAAVSAERAGRSDDLKLDIVPVEQLRISQASLHKIIEELVDNACKFSIPGTPVQVDTRMNEHDYLVRVHDEGRGMTPAQIGNLAAYQQFQRKIFEQQGAGLGLIIAQSLSELHGGKLTIDSSPDHHTDVVVTFCIS